MMNTVSIPHERDGDDVVGYGSYRILETFSGPADEADDPVLQYLRRKIASSPVLPVLGITKAVETVITGYASSNRTQSALEALGLEY